MQFVDGHDQEGKLPVWPECDELAVAQEMAAPHESVQGVHRQVFDFDAQGNLTSAARYDLKGELVANLRGVARETWVWKDDKITERTLYSRRGPLASYRLSYDGKSRVAKKAVVDATSNPAPDYLGVAAYEFEYDGDDRVTRETRRNAAGAVFEVHTYDYAAFDQVARHKIMDGDGKVLTTYLHEYAKKGARTKLEVYDGDLAAGKLKADYNGVAVYRFEYTEKGKLARETRHGPQDNILVNGLDGWASIENNYDPGGWRLEGTKRVRVDAAGNSVYEELLDGDGNRISFRLERPFPVRMVLRKAREGMQGRKGPAEEEGAHEDAGERYRERLKKIGARHGYLKLPYYPLDARVTIVRRTFCLDSPDDVTAEECAQPQEIKNITHELNEGEEIPELKIENLPVRERGMLCLEDRRFYPESRQFCPGHEQCLEKARNGDEPEECMKYALAYVQHCPRDGRYYVEEGPGIMTCGDGETLTDPAMVPLFEHRYEFLFERKDFLPAVVSYNASDWVHLGSGTYTIMFPRDFSLLRDWQTTKAKYAATRRQMRCWRLDWDDAWDDYKRNRVVALAKEKQAEDAKRKEEKGAVFKEVRGKYLEKVKELDVVREAPRSGTDPAEKSVLETYTKDIDAYLQSVDDYAGSEPYEDLLSRIDGSGRFLEYVILAYLYDLDAFNDALARYARSRQVNYRRDAAMRGVVASDEFRGLKEAMEMAWWTGSNVAFNEWYYRLWALDVQSCLLFVKEHDAERYGADLKKVREFVGGKIGEPGGMAQGIRDALSSLEQNDSATQQKLLSEYAVKMEPMFSNEEAYSKLREGNAGLPDYQEAMKEIINNDIHIRYFRLLSLVGPPGKYEQEFSRLDLREAREVARWVDPARYVYLADLIWLMDIPGRYSDSVPMLTDSLQVDFGLYEVQFNKLKEWSRAKSGVVTKYGRGKRLAKSLFKEPAYVQRALTKQLKLDNRAVLLAQNLEDYEEAVLATLVANAMEELRDEIDSGQHDSWNSHVKTNDERIRMDAGFSKREWESLTKEFEEAPDHEVWYSSLTETLAEKRLDCKGVSYPEPESFKEWREEAK